MHLGLLPIGANVTDILWFFSCITDLIIDSV